MAISSTAERASAVATHPLYATWAPVWRKLAHVYEGSGGFLDGTYLVGHPREWEDYKAATPKKPSKKLKARRAIARYENVAATLLNQLQSALFRGDVTRLIGDDEDSTKSHPLHAWWQNVDGKQTPIADYMAQTWPVCGIFGHLVHLMDRPAEDQSAATAADQSAPYLRAYTPLDLADWLEDDQGFLTAVKLLETEPRTDLNQVSDLNTQRVRIVTKTNWKLSTVTRNAVGVVNEGAHDFGKLPVVIQFAKRRALTSILGQSVLNDPQLYIDLYNLTSELRELLRNQTFSQLNIVLGTGPEAINVEQAKEMLQASGGSGTENVVFSAAASNFITAESSNVEVYQKERADLIRTIYRLAGVPWESDSRDAEAEGSLKLKREAMNQILAAYADECEKAEYQFVELWFRSEYGDRWKQELEDAKVTIRYPDTFDVTPFQEILEQAQAALSLEMPPAFMKELRKRLVTKFLPDASPALIKEIDDELEKMAKDAAKMDATTVRAKLLSIASGAHPDAPLPQPAEKEIAA